jgi:ferredoxin
VSQCLMACRWMDPETYGRVGSMSAVVRQPETPDQRRRALQALHACPTHSIQVKHQVSCRCLTC